MSSLTDLYNSHREVAVVVVFLLAVAAHITAGVLLAVFRRHDFDWHHLGSFVENDVWTKRGGAILATFLITVAAATGSNADLHAAYTPALLALVATTGANTLSVVRDTLYDLIELVSGVVVNQPPAAATARSAP
jgi:hypothetical protein